MIRRPGKDTLARRFHQTHSVRRPESVSSPAHERLDKCDLSEKLASQSLGLGGQSALVIVEP
jgi:hypothetical protein